MKWNLQFLVWCVVLGVGSARGWAHQDLQALITRLSEQLSTNRNNLNVLLMRAELYRLHTNWAEAGKDYAAAAKLSPRSSDVLLGQGQLQADMGENAEARRAFDTVLRIEPTNCAALFGRAQVFARLGDRHAAIADYSRGLALTPHPQPEYYLERASLQMVEADPEAAIAGLDEGMARLGWLVALQQQALELELTRHRPDLALQRLESILAHSARKEPWLAKKAEILLAAGRKSEARTVLEAALAAMEQLPPRFKTSPAMTEIRTKLQSLLLATSATPENESAGAALPSATPTSLPN